MNMFLALGAPPCRATCPASEPGLGATRQPAESYGSYGSYGHTVIRRLGTAPPAAPAWHRSLLAAPPARHRSLLPAEPAPHRGRNSDYTPRSEFRLRFFARKNPSPGQRRRSGSNAVLAASLPECFFHHSHAQPSILAWAQDCSLNPGVATGLLHPILLWQQDCHCQSWAGRRIASPIPVLTVGLPRRTTSSSGLELFLPEHRLVMESAPL